MIFPTPPPWHRPRVAVGCPPMGGEDGLAGEIPALLHVVVDKILEEELVHSSANLSKGDLFLWFGSGLHVLRRFLQGHNTRSGKLIECRFTLSPCNVRVFP